jgi:hypothetical protein
MGGALAVLLMAFFARKLLGLTPDFDVYIDNSGFLTPVTIDQFPPHFQRRLTQNDCQQIHNHGRL